MDRQLPTSSAASWPTCAARRAFAERATGSVRASDPRWSAASSSWCGRSLAAHPAFRARPTSPSRPRPRSHAGGRAPHRGGPAPHRPALSRRRDRPALGSARCTRDRRRAIAWRRPPTSRSSRGPVAERTASAAAPAAAGRRRRGRRPARDLDDPPRRAGRERRGSDGPAASGRPEQDAGRPTSPTCSPSCRKPGLCGRRARPARCFDSDAVTRPGRRSSRGRPGRAGIVYPEWHLWLGALPPARCRRLVPRRPGRLRRLGGGGDGPSRCAGAPRAPSLRRTPGPDASACAGRTTVPSSISPPTSPLSPTGRPTIPSDDRFYAATRRARRDLALALLVDVSASTDSWVSGGHRIIDVEKESLIVLLEALDALGDRHAAVAFSGEGRAACAC